MVFLYSLLKKYNLLYGTLVNIRGVKNKQKYNGLKLIEKAKDSIGYYLEPKRFCTPVILGVYEKKNKTHPNVLTYEGFPSVISTILLSEAI